MPAKKLTPKQELFIEHYLANGANGVQAAKSAGYNGSDNTLASVAKENLRKPHIKETLKKSQKSIKKELGITAEWKREMLKTVVERSLQAEEVTDNDGNGLGEYKFAGGDVIRAIAELNKMDGDHASKKVEQTGEFMFVIDGDDANL